MSIKAPKTVRVLAFLLFLPLLFPWTSLADTPPVVSVENGKWPIFNSYYTIKGYATDADGIAACEWIQADGPTALELFDTDKSNAVFRPSVPGLYRFAFRAYDGTSWSSFATNNALITNTPPIFLATNATGRIFEPLILGGSATDPDPDPSLASCEWSLVSGPTTLQFSATNAVNPLVTATQVGTYRIKVRASDGYDWSGYSTNTVVMLANTRPVAVASNGKGSFNSPVTLKASVFDAETSCKEFQWTKLSGPVDVTLTPSGSVLAPFFVPLDLGVYRFSLRTFDGGFWSSYSTNTIEITNTPPQSFPSNGLVAAGTAHTMKASVVDIDPGTQSFVYQWSVISGPESVTLSDLTALEPSFTPGIAGVYLFSLQAMDDFGYGEPVTNRITVTGNTIPTVVVTNGRSTVNVAVDLAASATDIESPIAAYEWQQVSGPSVSISDASVERPFFTPDQLGQYRFVFRASDGLYWSLWSTNVVMITNGAPVVTMSDTTGFIKTNNLLNATISDPDPATPIVDYHWSFVSGSHPVTLSSTNIWHPSFVSLTTGVFRFRLTVFDGYNWSAWATNRVFVGNMPPSVFVTNVRGMVGFPVKLQGACQDPDNGVVAFRWRQISGPSVPVSFSNFLVASFKPEYTGTYRFAFSASDGLDWSAEKTNIVLVSNIIPRIRVKNVVGVMGSAVKMDTEILDMNSTSAIPLYQWQFISGPETVVLAGADSAQAILKAERAGEYFFRCRVNDGYAWSSFATNKATVASPVEDRAYLHPFKAAAGGVVQIRNVKPGSEVKVYSIMGVGVGHSVQASATGDAAWTVPVDLDEGIYICVIRDKEGSVQHLKIRVVAP